MRAVLGSIPQMFVMAAIVATALCVPVWALLALFAHFIFGVPVHAFLTFGESVNAVEGIVIWWAVMLVPSLVYAAYGMPWISDRT